MGTGLFSAFHLAVAIVPLAAYFLLLGLIHLGKRPFLFTGTRDTAAIGIGLIGFIAVGPMELFMPMAAANQFGPYVWLLLLALYVLGVSLIVLVLPPRLIIYNSTLDQIRPLLADVVFRLDADAKWAGECLSMPNLGVQLHVVASEWCRTVQLVAVGRRQDYGGWKRLERSLVERLSPQTAARNGWGPVMLLIAVALVCLAVIGVARDPTTVANSLRDTLRW